MPERMACHVKQGLPSAVNSVPVVLRAGAIIVRQRRLGIDAGKTTPGRMHPKTT